MASYEDLVSREALIKQLEEMANDVWNIQIGSSKGLEDAIDVIENAPTVDLKNIYQEGHYDGQLEGYTRAINEERPQGEWKLIRVADHCGIHDSFVCPFCNYEREYRKKNFCEECGADLRGEKADND